MATATAPVSVIRDAPKAGVLLKPLRREILAHARTPVVGGRHCRGDGTTSAGGQLSRARAGPGRIPSPGRPRQEARPRPNNATSSRPGLRAGARNARRPRRHRDHRDHRQDQRRLPADARRHDCSGSSANRGASRRRRRTPLPLLSLDTEFGFSSTAHRARFAEALLNAITTVVAEHTTHGRSIRGGAIPDGDRLLPNTILTWR